MVIGSPDRVSGDARGHSLSGQDNTSVPVPHRRSGYAPRCSPPAPRARRHGLAGGIAVLLALGALSPAAAESPVAGAPRADLAACVSEPDPVARLACYDRLAGREPAIGQGRPGEAPVPVSRSGGASGSGIVGPGAPHVAWPGSSAGDALPALGASPAPDAGDGPTPAQGTQPAAAPSLATARPNGLMSAFWELEREDKRGTFNIKTYRPNFFLPAHYTNAINNAPVSPTRGTAVDLPKYRNTEVKLNLSLRAKVAQSVLLPDADLWFGYTQQSFWQLWNSPASSPFRSTDYEPELIYVVPVSPRWRDLPGGWKLRMAQLGVAHQSNGQTDPISRSWNRVYLAAGLEKGEFGVLARIHRRVKEDGADDDNPDLTDYLGRGDIRVNWLPGLATASLTWRMGGPALSRGSMQLDWTYPVDSENPQGLRWYVQYFNGFGESLLDYNHRQSSLGLGVTLFNF